MSPRPISGGYQDSPTSPGVVSIDRGLRPAVDKSCGEQIQVSMDGKCR